MSDDIPIDLWPKILVNLPVKSLVQCTSVCKQWHSLITSPSFIDIHLSSSLHRPSQLLLTPTIEKEHRSFFFSIDNQKCYFVTLQTDPPEPTQNFQRPFPARTITNSRQGFVLYYRVVGSLHGLVCLSDDTIYGYTEITILWNPLIHKSLRLPRPQFIFDTVGTYAMMMGFGFDSGKNDYKVVRIVYQQIRMGEDLLPPLVEVYSINEGSWRTVNSDSVQHCFWEREWNQCFIHGALHWVAYDKDKLGPGSFHEHVILLFDAGTDLFSTMLLPESLVYAHAATLSVAVIGGLLSVLHECSSIWVQREYGEVSSWTKIFNLEESIDLGMAIQCRNYVETLLKSSVGENTACDCKDLQLPNTHKSSMRVDGFYAFSYTETLLMLDKQRWFKVHPRSNKMTIDGPKKSGKKLEAGPGEAEIDSSNRCSEEEEQQQQEEQEEQNALEDEEEEENALEEED